MKIAVAQIGYDDAEPMPARVDRVAALVRGLAGHDLIVLPELWGAGGFAYREWGRRAQSLDGPIATAMSAAARDAGALVHAGSIVERTPSPGPQGKHLWNTALVFGPDGSLVAAYRKIHRFGFGQGEPTLMEAGHEVVVADLPLPSGARLRAGLSTCYDLRFPELYRRQLDAGAQAFLVPAAWPAARVAHWELLVRARAVEDQCLVVAANTAGTHADVPMGGRSCVVLPTGEVIAAAGTDEQVLSVEVDLGVVAASREAFPVLADRRL
ncbi:MAG: carbon-nitrogen family hydrolase [Dermatophilaceae bacterium]